MSKGRGKSETITKIGEWSEVKLQILKEYARAYSVVLSNQPKLQHWYIDAFAGAGAHISRTSGELVPGSPLNALNIVPPFKKHFLIDLDSSKVAMLKGITEGRDDVEIREGDCNDILTKEVFPQLPFHTYRRALCLLDPYGLHLDWHVMKMAGELRTIDIFINFPVMDINMNALRSNVPDPGAECVQRMNRFWGDESWRAVVFQSHPDLFNGSREIKVDDHRALVMAFRDRLKQHAGFECVPDPIPMRNTSGSDLYYLFFASHQKVAAKIAGEIFKKYRKKYGD